MHLSPHWGPVDLLCLCLCISICISVCLSVCMSVSLSGCLHPFLADIRADRNCVQRMRPKAAGSNPLSGSIIYPFVCPSVSPVVRGTFAIFVFVFNSFTTRDDYYCCYYYQCGGPASVMHFPHTGVRRTPVGSSRYYVSVHLSLCLSVSLSLYLFGCPCRFLVNSRAACNCVQRMRL